jgi:sigma-B regulation protein RsbU (phosphoserine phosphatase)
VSAELDAAIAAEDVALHELYDGAPCGYVSTIADGTIIKINTTLASWLGSSPGELVGRRRFTDLLTVGGRIHYETHIAPLLSMQGSVGGFALELRTPGGDRLPVLVSATARRGHDGAPDRIRVVVFEARDRRSYEGELLRARRLADEERDRVQRLATVLQQTLLPPRLPEVPGVEASAHYHPASLDEVGGDFYDLYRLPDGRWGFFLGDVCGKGAEAAALTSLTRYTLRSAAAGDPDPGHVLRTLNAVLTQERDPADPKLCTVVAGLLTPGPDGAAVVLAGGGHPPPLALRATGAAEFLHLAGGQILGAIARPVFARVDTVLAPGDTLLLYTDGLTEARIDGTRERYGEDALLRFGHSLAPASAREAVDAVVAVIAGFGTGLDDDVALLALGRRRS